MTTITSFTKEQLITHITRHSDEINRLIKQQSHHDNEYRKKLLAVNEIALKVLTDGDKLEAAEKRVAELEAKLANPVLLPKTNGYWTEQEKAYEEAIALAKQRVRLAGFRCAGDE